MTVGCVPSVVVAISRTHVDATVDSDIQERLSAAFVTPLT